MPTTTTTVSTSCHKCHPPLSVHYQRRSRSSTSLASPRTRQRPPITMMMILTTNTASISDQKASTHTSLTSRATLPQKPSHLAGLHKNEHQQRQMSHLSSTHRQVHTARQHHTAVTLPPPAHQQRGVSTSSLLSQLLPVQLSWARMRV